MIIMFIRFLHAIGLTNLSDQEVDRYYVVKKERPSISRIIETLSFIAPLSSTVSKDMIAMVESLRTNERLKEIDISHRHELEKLELEVAKAEAEYQLVVARSGLELETKRSIEVEVGNMINMLESVDEVAVQVENMVFLKTHFDERAVVISKVLENSTLKELEENPSLLKSPRELAKRLKLTEEISLNDGVIQHGKPNK